MSNRAAIAREMPSLLAHEGEWAGSYRHVDADGSPVDQHEARIRCEFPDTGAPHYVQHNHFLWPDGRETRATLPGVLLDGRLHWDTPTFSGSAWEGGGGTILLTLDRKDEPDTRFTEIIILGEGGRHRARTWHWFCGGQLIRRTLCTESRV